MGTTSHQILARPGSGSLIFVPSGSGYIASTALTASVAAHHRYTLTSSVAYHDEFSSGSIYYPSIHTSSFWTFATSHTAYTNAYKEFYVYYQTGSSNYTTQPAIPTPAGKGTGIQTGSIPILVTIETSMSAALIASQSANAINDNTFNTGLVSASWSGSGQVDIVNLTTGVTHYDPIVSGSGFSYKVITSGSGAQYQNAYLGNPDYNSGSIEFMLDPDNKRSFVISGSGTTKMYFSGSGKMGFGTTNPIKEMDFRADTFQFQKKASQKGMRINEDGDLESYNFDATSAATGSEMIMSYTPGGIGSITALHIAAFIGDEISPEISDEGHAAALTTYINALSPDRLLDLLNYVDSKGGFGQASIGDVIGSIRWVVNSGSSTAFDSRVAGEAANIKSTVVATGDDGVVSRLKFSLAKTTSTAPTGMLDIQGDSGKVIISASNGFHGINAGKVIGPNCNIGGFRSGSFLYVSASDIQTSRIQPGYDSSGLTLQGSVTASGDISASGYITGNYILAKRPIVQLSGGDTKTTNTDNTNSSGDINDAAAQLSWTVTDFSDTDYYSVSSSWGIGVKQTGRYRLSTHVNVLTGGARPGCMVQFYTGSAFGVAAAKVLPPEGWTYIRKPDANAIKGNLNIDNYIVQLSSGSFVSIVAKNDASYGGGAIVTWSGSLSYFNIEYLGA